MKPEVHVQLIDNDPGAGGELAGAFVIPGGPPLNTTSVEFSILWHTSGKGDEDLGIIFYQDWTADNLSQMPNPYSFTVRLPRTPQSYEGNLINIHWLARLRLRYGVKEEVLEEAHFLLLPKP